MITPRSYAKHRKVALSTVQAWIGDGKLSSSLTRDARGRVCIRSKAAADREIDASLSSTPGPAGTAFREARTANMTAAARERRARAEKAELELASRRGELISVAEARAGIMAEFRHVRDRLRAIPHKFKAERPDIERADIQRLAELIDEVLTALADEDAERVVEQAARRSA